MLREALSADSSGGFPRIVYGVCPGGQLQEVWAMWTLEPEVVVPGAVFMDKVSVQYEDVIWDDTEAVDGRSTDIYLYWLVAKRDMGDCHVRFKMKSEYFTI